MTRWTTDDIDETEEAIAQRDLLKHVRQFLIDNNADELLIETVDVAIEDIQDWINSDIEAVLTNRAFQL